MKKPSISVVMPAYNAQKFIKTAIDSILNQTYINFEFIIINDGSTDKTGEIISSFTDDRIILIDKPKNAGLIAALNDGIERAKGEYIARMDADDESLPERFQKQIDFMQKNPDIGILGTAIFKINGSKNKTIYVSKTHKQCLDSLVRGVCVAHPTVMIRSEVLVNMKYNEAYPSAEDYKLWVDLAKNGAKFANLSIPLLKYNRHDDNISIKAKTQQFNSAKLIQKEYIKFYFNQYINGNDNKELEWMLEYSKGDMSLKRIDIFYNKVTKGKLHNAQIVNFIFKNTIRSKIKFIKYNFPEKITLIVFAYYLVFKIVRLMR